MTPTSAYSSAQNGLAEKPNLNLANMMRRLMYGAGLSGQYWSYTLRLQSTSKIGHHTPHSSPDWTTSYEYFNGTKPDLSCLEIF